MLISIGDARDRFTEILNQENQENRENGVTNEKSQEGLTNERSQGEGTDKASSSNVGIENDKDDDHKELAQSSESDAKGKKIEIEKADEGSSHCLSK